jgi:putative endonuclease
MSKHLKLGQIGEDKAADYLKKNGYKIIARRYKCRSGEIDIIAIKKKKLVFVEVKTRSYNAFGGPLAAIGKAKQKKIISTALWFLKEKKLKPEQISFDVITLLENDKISHIENAFVPERFFSY